MTTRKMLRDKWYADDGGIFAGKMLEAGVFVDG
jgi:hypothetical protein